MSAATGALPSATRADAPSAPAWIAGAFVIVLAGLSLLTPALNADLGWHLRTGVSILQTHAIPNTDPYSFTRAGTPWVEHEWLWQVGVTLVARAWGEIGIVVVNAALASLAAGLVYARLRFAGVGPLFAAGGAALTATITAFTAEARPSLLVAPFCAAFLLCCDGFRRTGKARWLVVLPVLQVVWANSHGSFVIGPLLCGLYAAAALWERPSRAHLQPWGALLAALVGASLLNPLGLELLRFMLFASRLPFNREFIAEWQPPNFRSWSFAPLLGSLVLLGGLPLLRRRPALTKSQIVTGSISTGLCLYSQQFVLLFAVAAAPLVAYMAFDALRQYDRQQLSVVSAIALTVTAGLFAIVLPPRQLSPSGYQHTFSQFYPVEAVHFVEQAQLPGRMWNEFEWGGYLIGQLPEVPVFVDGRTELYGNDFMYQYARVTLGQQAPEPVLDEYGIGFALIKQDSPMAAELRGLPEWQEAYTDNLASVFVRTA